MKKVDFTKEKFLVFSGTPGIVETHSLANYTFLMNKPCTLFEFNLSLYKLLLWNGRVSICDPRKNYSFPFDLFYEIRDDEAESMPYDDPNTEHIIKLIVGSDWPFTVKNKGESYKALIVSQSNFERLFQLPLPTIRDYHSYKILDIEYFESDSLPPRISFFASPKTYSLYLSDGESLRTNIPLDFLEDFYKKIEVINDEYSKYIEG